MLLDFLPVIFFFIALFYSSVGFGGGSSYLAILSLVLPDFYEIRSTSLILNICVVGIGSIVYFRNGLIKPGKIWPFFLLSIPMAYLGATLKLSQQNFFLILGFALIMAGIFMVLKIAKPKLDSVELSVYQKMGLGGAIGLLSGISGIGGGIFLAPSLNLLRWQNARFIAGLASVFILVNSVSGLTGLFMTGTFQIDQALIIKLIIAVILGGSVGSYLSSRKLNLKLLGILTALLIFYVGLRLILLNLFEIRI